MSRKPPALSGWALSLAAIACAVAAETPPAAIPPAPASAAAKLIIVADEMPAMGVLAEFLRTEGKYTVQCVQPKDLPKDLSGYFAVFQYLHGPMDAATEKALVAYALAGGRLVMLHHGLASARVKNPDLLKICGLAIPPRTDPKTPWRVIANVTFTLVNLAPRHYITSHGVTYDRTAEYKSSDDRALPAALPALDLPNTEVFLNQQFTDGREKTVLFGARCTDPATGQVHMQDRGGWYKAAGKGWVFYLQPGHLAADFKNRQYCQIIWNCLTWRPDMGPEPADARVKTPAAPQNAETPAKPASGS
jgi:hypothetical protein